MWCWLRISLVSRWMTVTVVARKESCHVTDATKADTDKYVAGEIDLNQLAAMVRARYGID